jgi:hypothetical protein
MRNQIAAIIRVACLIIMICFIAQGNQKPVHGWRLISQARGIELVDVDETATDLTFTLKNVSGRTITAFAVSFIGENNERLNQYEDWFGSENASFGINQELQITHGREMMDGFRNRAITVGAVVYDDGEKEGDQGLIDSIEGKRLGKMLETGRIRAILNDPTTECRTAGGIAEIKRSIGSLPESGEEAQKLLSRREDSGENPSDQKRALKPKYLAGFLSGVRTAREDALRHADRLLTLPDEFNGTGEPTRIEYMQKIQKSYDDKNERMHRHYARALGGEDK